MVNNTVQRIGEKLERLSRRNFSLGSSLKLLARRARTVEEQIVVEVMREVYTELHPEHEFGIYPESRSRSA